MAVPARARTVTINSQPAVEVIEVESEGEGATEQESVAVNQTDGTVHTHGDTYMAGADEEEDEQDNPWKGLG